MPGISHPKEGKVYACPNCDNTSNIVKRLRVDQYEGDEQYRCDSCGFTFDQPTERDAKADHDTNGFPAKYEDVLMDKDPEDIL